MQYSTQFEKLKDGVVLDKSRHYARWTIAGLMHRGNKDGKAHQVEGDFQSQGAIFVNTLASKLAGLLFPTTTPFMRITLDNNSKAALQEAGLGGDDLESVLANLEMEASQRIFRNASYNQLTLCLKHLIVTGNAALYRDSETGRVVTYGLNDFVVKRDGLGQVVEALVRERTFYESLPDHIKALLDQRYNGRFTGNTPYEKPLYTYTRILRTPTPDGQRVFYGVSQQIEDVELPAEFSGTYPEYTLPWIFPTWTLFSGENYGRGLVEEHAGDMAKLSEVSEAMTLYEIEAMRIINLVGDTSASNIDELQVADIGSWVKANPDAVTAFESGSSNKLELIAANLDMVVQRLSRAFMFQGNARDSERTTATEIRQDAQEVENALGGAYSSLAESLQLPLSYVLLEEVDPEFMIALIASNSGSRLDINTGINALGRATKVQNILQALQEGQAAVELAQLADQRIDPTKLVDLILAGRSVDPSEIFKSDEQLQAELEAEEQQQQALAQMQAAQTAPDPQEVVQGNQPMI